MREKKLVLVFPDNFISIGGKRVIIMIGTFVNYPALTGLPASWSRLAKG